MNKWYGNIGFAETVETEPGLWEPRVIERPYFGDIMENRWKRQPTENVNDDINLSNKISIVADPYAMNHCSTMVYAEYMGAKWKISDVEVQYPRLILNMGGVWNA